MMLDTELTVIAQNPDLINAYKEYGYAVVDGVFGFYTQPHTIGSEKYGAWEFVPAKKVLAETDWVSFAKFIKRIARRLHQK